MATTGVVKGNALIVYMDDQDGSGLRAIACSTDASVNITNEEIETTCKDNDGAKTYLSGGTDWTMNVSGLVKYDADRGYEDVLDATLNKTTVTVRYTTNVDGDSYLQGSATITSFDSSSPLNGAATWSVVFKGNGTLTKGTET